MSKPNDCSSSCPFWRRCLDKVDPVERSLRVTEQGLLACSCFVTAQVTISLLGKRQVNLAKIAQIPGTLRSCSNLALSVREWVEFAERDAKGVREALGLLASLLVPCAILSSWGVRPLAPHANLLKYAGGVCLVSKGLLDLEEAGEVLNDFCTETPAEHLCPEVLQALIGISTGLWWLYNNDEARPS